MALRLTGSKGQAAALALAAGAMIAACTLDVTGIQGASSSTGTGGSATTSTASSSGTASTSTATATAASSSSGGPAVCGDGKLEMGEACDDGNLTPGDGCSATCTEESSDECPGTLFTLTSKGLTFKDTLAMRANDLAPSCGANQGDLVYAIQPAASGTLKATLKGAFAKSISIRTTCADGPTSELVCDTGTDDRSARVWVYPGVTYWVVVDGDPQAFELDLALSPCGNGKKEELEECDNPGDPNCVGCFKCDGAGEFADSISRHCYRLVQDKDKIWQDARADCIAWGGDLAGIGSQAEIDFLYQHQNPQLGSYTWTGGNDLAQNCAFNNVNGEPWEARWANNEPNDSGGNEDCVQIYNDGTMNDTHCTDTIDYLCERAPGGKCGDGILQPGEECDDSLFSGFYDCNNCVLTCKAGEFKDPATHHCYRLITGVATALTWDLAKTVCSSFNAYLASVTTPAEVTLVKQQLLGPTWLGGRRNGSFGWLNGDPFCYVNWGGMQPNSNGGADCLMTLPDGTWSNDNCTFQKDFLCERDN